MGRRLHAVAQGKVLIAGVSYNTRAHHAQFMSLHNANLCGTCPCLFTDVLVMSAPYVRRTFFLDPELLVGTLHYTAPYPAPYFPASARTGFCTGSLVGVTSDPARGMGQQC